MRARLVAAAATVAMVSAVGCSIITSYDGYDDKFGRVTDGNAASMPDGTVPTSDAGMNPFDGDLACSPDIPSAPTMQRSSPANKSTMRARPADDGSRSTRCKT